MNTNKKILSMGVILFIAGIAAASMSYTPSLVLQYVFVVSSLAVGVIGILIGKNKEGSLMRSTYSRGLALF